MQGLKKLVGVRRSVRGVIFDMDGTLTEPILDFVKMRKRVVSPPCSFFALLR
jgi:hypothetical protein